MSNKPRSAERAPDGIVPPGLGRQLAGGPTKPTVKVGPHNGGELIGMLESELPPGAGFPAHVHDDYEEIFYVLAGEIDYLIEDTWATAPAGATVFIPAGRIHAWRNTKAEPARHLAITSPAEGMTMIEEAIHAGPGQLASVLARYRSRLIADEAGARPPAGPHASSQ
jgi:quercetin dioxygenase-like cupin family protein